MHYLIATLVISLAVLAARFSPESKKERAGNLAVKLPTARVCEVTPTPTPPQPGQG
jgi:hypothetical protein